MFGRYLSSCFLARARSRFHYSLRYRLPSVARAQTGRSIANAVSQSFKNMKMKFNKLYFLAFLLLMAIETLIAIYFKDGFIRHTFGDYLVVILLYCCIKSFITGKTFQIALLVLIISYAIELLQLSNFLEFLHLQNNSIAKIVLGSTFSFGDLLAYTLGIISILLLEMMLNKPLEFKLFLNPIK